jgi:hypothetical protein
MLDTNYVDDRPSEKALNKSDFGQSTPNLSQDNPSFGSDGAGYKAVADQSHDFDD